MFLTRIGFDSKAVVTGDVTQIDLPIQKTSGLVEAAEIVGSIEGIARIHLDETDVVRHPLVQRIILAYDRHESSRRDRSGGGRLPNGQAAADPRDPSTERESP
jgi:phosphate starvation-inducible PhoH-like protein